MLLDVLDLTETQRGHGQSIAAYISDAFPIWNASQQSASLKQTASSTSYSAFLSSPLLPAGLDWNPDTLVVI